MLNKNALSDETASKAIKALSCPHCGIPVARWCAGSEAKEQKQQEKTGCQTDSDKSVKIKNRNLKKTLFGLWYGWQR